MAYFKKPLKVGTLNVRGLASRRRQVQLNRLLGELDLDIAAIQETKVEDEQQTDNMVFAFRSRFNVCVSHAAGLSAGCCLFLRKDIGIAEKEVVTCARGRFIVCDFMYEKLELRVIAVYAPTVRKERREFFEQLVPFLECGRALIFLGDFNCVLDPNDRSNGSVVKDSSAEFLKGVLNECSLEDVTGLVNGRKRVHFTHFQGISHARLDRIYVSPEFSPSCEEYEVKQVSFSDHCLVMVTLGGMKQRKAKMNWDLWKINSRLTEDEKFVKKVKESMAIFDVSELSCIESWERFKQDVKINAIERSTLIKHEERKEEKQLRELLANLGREEEKMPGMFMHDIKGIKVRLEGLDAQKYRGAAIRARAEKWLTGEMPTKRVLSDEKRYARSSEIADIEYKGQIRSDQSGIASAFVEHYRELFAGKIPSEEGFRETFLPLMPKLEKEITEELEKEISVEEIETAIDELNAGKSPGPDGLSAAFYKSFKNRLTIMLYKLFKECFQVGSLPPSFSNAHTVLVPKTDEPAKLVQVTSYRPITLTNVDYKILMKVLAKRLQYVIKDIVGPHQTCGIKGRSIFNNIHVARSVLECCDALNRKVAMVQIDFAKAFDRVSHEILYCLLEHIGIGSVMVKGVKMAYACCSTRLMINKVLSEKIDVRASVRQGCPLSPLLFAIYLEPFCRMLTASDHIRGFRLGACEVRVLAYADDVALFCEDRRSVQEALRVTEMFCRQTDSAVNLDKCLGVWHGQWDLEPEFFCGVRWATAPGVYLGVPLDRYGENTSYWNEKAEEMRDRTKGWTGRNLSIFARATVCNTFLAARIMYLLQVLYCARTNIQRFHRVFAVFIWSSNWERINRDSLFRRVKDGGLSLIHLYVRQVVFRFCFLRDQNGAFLRTFMQIMLSSAIPEFIVSSCSARRYTVSRFLREVVWSFRFLRVRFSVEYLASVTPRQLYKNLVGQLFPAPLYRTLYCEGPGKNVLRRVKNMAVAPGVKTFFFKLHTGSLPVKTWLEEKGLFVPWGSNCLLCRKPETVEHVFLDCWDAVFYWDVLQRTLKKDLPLTPCGIRYLTTENDVVQYDQIMLLGLHSIWRSRMAVRHCDLDARSVCAYFVEHVCKLREVLKQQDCADDVLSLMDQLAVMKVH